MGIYFRKSLVKSQRMLCEDRMWNKLHQVFDILTESFSEQLSVNKTKRMKFGVKWSKVKKRFWNDSRYFRRCIKFRHWSSWFITPTYVYCIRSILNRKWKSCKIEKFLGKGEWNGEWSYLSPKWASKLWKRKWIK